ncbi:unnamed protein product [marine sediment metagenome]|uniref:Uncharacterized protein n=1 Tax=marine sediment metagenome TaxID=412755 RepID=X1K134_9ZZZZ
MKNSWTIAKRDLNSLFLNSYIAYIILFVFYELSGVFFYTYVKYSARADLNGFFSNMYIMLIFLVPILTARAFAEK